MIFTYPKRLLEGNNPVCAHLQLHLFDINDLVMANWHHTVTESLLYKKRH